MKRLFLLFLALCQVYGLVAQNIGIGTTTPAAKLDVNGNVRVNKHITLTTQTVGAGTTITLPDAGTVVISDDASTASNVATFSGTPSSGQYLTIINNDADAVAFGSHAVLSGKAQTFVYNGSAWKSISGVARQQFDPKYPHDFNDFQPVHVDMRSVSTYTVPAGKVLYITSIATNGTNYEIGGINPSGTTPIVANNPIVNQQSYKSNLHNPIILPEGSSYHRSGGSPPHPAFANGFKGVLVDADPAIEPISAQETYTVPSGKQFIVLNIYSQNSRLQVDTGSGFETFSYLLDYGENFDASLSLPAFLRQPLFFDAGTQLRFFGASESDSYLTGYLRDQP